jgi:hypothetical protein
MSKTQLEKIREYFKLNECELSGPYPNAFADHYKAKLPDGCELSLSFNEDGKFNKGGFLTYPNGGGTVLTMTFTKVMNYLKRPKRYGKVELVEGNEIKVGTACTINHYTDREPATIVEVVSPKKIIIRKDKATLKPEFTPEISSGGFAGHCVNNDAQEYDYEQDLNGATLTYTLRSNGKWIQEGQTLNDKPLSIGFRKKFHDYNF